MEPQNEWVFFRDIDWGCPKNNKFNVDTRDFHVGYTYDDSRIKFHKILKGNYLLSEEQLKTLLNRYFEESGGEVGWRFFQLEGTRNWSLKYLRIRRTEYGFLVYDDKGTLLKRSILDRKINLEHLHAH